MPGNPRGTLPGETRHGARRIGTPGSTSRLAPERPHRGRRADRRSRHPCGCGHRGPQGTDTAWQDWPKGVRSMSRSGRSAPRSAAANGATTMNRIPWLNQHQTLAAACSFVIGPPARRQVRCLGFIRLCRPTPGRAVQSGAHLLANGSNERRVDSLAHGIGWPLPSLKVTT